jgi:hypothetical protein
MPVYDRFVPVLERPLPALYLISDADTALVARLRLHGVEITRAQNGQPGIEEFVLDSIIRAPRPFQGHNEVRLVGRWRSRAAGVTAGLMVVRTDQRLGRLAALLLDPESDDSFATWNALDAQLALGAPYPVLRVPAPAH